ncbi:MAG: ubiquinol-cytochrome c reductase iron-sulfur subunit [Candidatus Eremiobacteraeota bacterium]|nr:ubiquinol-cytochrome c reductase iron-sulfur subunit [Candidatus Eremiobacteraeota bacterium]
MSVSESLHAEAYRDPGTPEEQSRRAFMANATVILGSVMGLVLAVPLIEYTIPGKAILELSGAEWSNLNEGEWKQLASSEVPKKITFSHRTQDGYFPPTSTDDYVWGVKMSEAQWTQMQKERADLFGSDALAHVRYPNQIYVGGFVIFSSVCPHLGCRFAWDPNRSGGRFFCPCHNSEYTREGKVVGGPAPRGLDPLPLREQSGAAQITWIRYKSSIPDRIVVSYA